MRLLQTAAVVILAALALGAPTSRAASFSHPRTATGAAKQATYSDLLRALAHRSVRAAAFDDSRHVVSLEYRDGRSALVRYPAADVSLPLRASRAGASVSIVGSSFTLLSLLPYLFFFLVVMAIAPVIRRQMVRRKREGATLEGDHVGTRAVEAVHVTPRTRFADIAGCDEAVEELAEIVAFLRSPERFTRVDARMPAGLLLTGPPGTGKTMLARALAGEAGVRFFAASGSEFVEKYVGVGASRVRDLFKRATANAPAVIFLDEVDAIGATRGYDGNGEREQTLNELLVRIDGFSESDRVVVVAATNRPEILDAALLRPGRFSRQITIGLPSVEGRRAILGVHSASKPLAPDVDLDSLAATTGGFSGAQLAELLNEAAIMAARESRDVIGRDDVLEGLRRVIAGPKRKSAAIAEGELEKIAYHEAGHVLCAELCEYHENAQHVTIDPRGNAMGFALFGQQDRALQDEAHLHEAMITALGGRAAEQIAFGRVSSGAKNDLEKVNSIARTAVTEYGMTLRIGQFAGDERRLSNETRALIDREIERLVARAYTGALALLEAHRGALDALAARLLDARELERVDIVAALA